MAVSQEDIAYEIFSWLPAKIIFKFKLTCSSFSKFPEESPFKTKQSCNLLGMSDACFFLQHDQISQRYQKRIELHHLPKEQQLSGVPNNVLTFLSNSACILASSNGLLLCHTINEDPIELFICNPITKSCFFIPSPESFRKIHNFSTVNVMLDCSNSSSSDDYFILLLENTEEWSPTSYACNIYHGKEGVWKSMENNFLSGGRNMKFDMPVFYNGAVHFISDCSDYFMRSSPFYKPYIVSYNFEKGTSTILELPREAIKGFHIECDMGIFNWGKVTSSNSSICLVKSRKSVFSIWILKDYNSCSWKKILKVRVNALGLEEKDAHVTGFTVMNGNILIFSTEHKIYSCGLDEETFMMVEEIGSHSCGSNPRFLSYSNTLRSCGTNDQTMPC
ncbi:uncharacterized protein LOC131658135 [Vicia villosa]|uniref:uncharacterized protein LOC131658135 n=1 Tax=Vicia villosa TaxID=3911 RepID=UPI00273C1E90|nr:uncharacterized protein LOC131658135 [Vicia villosa]